MTTIVRILFTLASLLIANSARADFLSVLGVDQGQNIEGTPGETVGYGFEFEVDVDYAVLDYSEFTPAPDFADYTDYLSNNFITTTPGAAVSQNFSNTVDLTTGITTETGLGQFFIHDNAVPGTIVSGVLTIVYDVYSVDPNDPNFDPIGDAVSFGNVINADVGLEVVAPTPTIPEPATSMLLGLGLIVLGSARFWRRRKKGMLYK